MSKESTLPETNVAPETLGLEDKFPFGARPPDRCYVSFREGTSSAQKIKGLGFVWWEAWGPQ